MSVFVCVNGRVYLGMCEGEYVYVFRCMCICVCV